MTNDDDDDDAQYRSSDTRSQSGLVLTKVSVPNISAAMSVCACIKTWSTSMRHSYAGMDMRVMGIFQVGPSARVHAKFRRQCAAVWRIGCLKCARCMHHHVSMALSYISVRTVTGQRKECDGIIMSTCSGRSDLRMHSTESSGSMRATTGRRITSAALGRLSGCHVRVHLRARQCLGVCMHVCEHVFWFACITESAQVSCCVYWDACMCESMCWCVGVHLGVCACVCVCVFQLQHISLHQCVDARTGQWLERVRIPLIVLVRAMRADAV